jgi:hypothetical protein
LKKQVAPVDWPFVVSQNRRNDMLRTLELMLWLVLVIWMCAAWRRIYLTAWQASETKGRKRGLKARSPEDCPACQAKLGLRGVNSHPAHEVRSWREVKGKGGRKKQSNTEGHACPNRACRYYGIREQKVHALVLQEKRGKTGGDLAVALSGVWETVL